MLISWKFESGIVFQVNVMEHQFSSRPPSSVATCPGELDSHWSGLYLDDVRQTHLTGKVVSEVRSHL